MREIGYQDVSAVLVTRGDIDLQPIIATLPYGEVIVWDNSVRDDWGVFGRYMAIPEASRSVIYFQDDDCLVHCHDALLDAYEPGVVVGNMLNEDRSRLSYYDDSTLLGWGSLFDRDLPERAFAAYSRFYLLDRDFKVSLGAETVFPMLSSTKTIIEGIEWLDQEGPVLERPNRMWKQPDFYEVRDWWMARAREVRDRIAA